MNDTSADRKKETSHSTLYRFGAMLIAGIVAGTVGWILIERYGEHFRVPEDVAAAAAAAGAGATPSADPAIMAEFDEVARRNRILQLGLMGMSIGGILGCTAAALSASVPRAIAGLAVGLVLGALFGLLGGFSAQEVFGWLQINARLSRSMQFIVMHLTAWVCVGTGVGLSLIGTARSIRHVPGFIVVGICSGIVAVVLQQLVCSIAFPMQNSEPLLPESTRLGLVWALTGGGSIGLMLGFALRHRAVVQPVEGAKTV